jgi:hypothetical protein
VDVKKQVSPLDDVQRKAAESAQRLHRKRLCDLGGSALIVVIVTKKKGGRTGALALLPVPPFLPIPPSDFVPFVHWEALRALRDQKSNCAVILKNRADMIESGLRYVDVALGGV